jgi:hypothetical protein
MKAICIKSKIFDFGKKYGGSSFKAERVRYMNTLETILDSIFKMKIERHYIII